MRSVSCVRSVLILVAVVLGTDWGATAVLAQDGAYIVEPWLGGYRAVMIQPGDQKIVAAGVRDYSHNGAVARYSSAGDPDVTYGSGGVATPPIQADGLMLQPDGKMVLAGHAVIDGSIDPAVARLNSNGSTDSSFGTGGWRNLDLGASFGAFIGVGLQSNGKIVATGRSFPVALAARFTASGAIDSGKGAFGDIVQGKAVGYTLNTFGAPYSSFVDLAVQSDDKVVVVGAIDTTGNGDQQLLVARYTASGTLDTTFNGKKGYSLLLPPGGASSTIALAVALQPNGKIVVAGTLAGTDRDDMLVARYNSNGTLDTTFGGGAGYVRLDIDGTASLTYERANDVAVQPDGQIVVAGAEFSAGMGDMSNVLVVRLNPNGTLDATFGVGGFKLGAPPAGHSFTGQAVALQSDGSIIVAGSDRPPAPTNPEYPLLMRFNP